MAQELYGRLTDYIIDGTTHLDGKVAQQGTSVKAASTLGVVAAAAYFATPQVVVGRYVIPDGTLGGIYIINDPGLVGEISLPKPLPGMHFAFVVGSAPVGAGYFIHVVGNDRIFGGVDSPQSIPSAVIFDSVHQFIFTQTAKPGDRVSLVSDAENWYIADGFVAESDGLRLNV